MRFSSSAIEEDRMVEDHFDHAIVRCKDLVHQIRDACDDAPCKESATGDAHPGLAQMRYQRVRLRTPSNARIYSNEILQPGRVGIVRC